MAIGSRRKGMVVAKPTSRMTAASLSSNRASVATHPQSKFPFMTQRAECYRGKAARCEEAARRVSDPETRTLYLDLAHRWRELARQAEALDRERGKE